MSIEHKFLNTDFGNGFKTHKAILSQTPYQPEMLFLGTFNPKTNNISNPADFFYGRNWFWIVLFNIFKYDNKVVLDKQRKFYKPNFQPSLEEIYEFMTAYKISFADLITEVLVNKESEVDYTLNDNKATYQGTEYDLINDTHLSHLNNLNLIEWSTKNLIDYIERNPTIKTIYFTRKSAQPFANEILKIRNHFKESELEIRYLFTPSGQGLRGKPRIRTLMNEWLVSTKDGYNNLKEDWKN